METRTQPRAPASSEPDRDRLGALLARPPKELETQGEELVSLLEQTAPAGLSPHAARLLELLDHSHFRRADTTDMTPREAIVRAVMRLGYPWALQLSPDDVGLARLDDRRHELNHSSRLRRVAMVVMTAVGLIVAGGLTVTRERPLPTADTLLESERVFTMPTIDQVVPPATRAELLTASMVDLGKQRHHDEAFALGFDCLADPDLEPKTCLSALASLMEQTNRNNNVTGDSALVSQLRDVQWQLKDKAHPPEGTLQLIRELRRGWLRPDPGLPPPASDGPPRLATIARVSLERGELEKARGEATDCLDQFPGTVECHLVLFTAHSAIASRVHPGEVKTHGDAMERQRLAIAKLVSHAKRRACELGQVPTPRPLGCPEPAR